MGPYLTHSESETSHPPNTGPLLVLKVLAACLFINRHQNGNQSARQIQGQPANWDVYGPPQAFGSQAFNVVADQEDTWL